MLAKTATIAAATAAAPTATYQAIVSARRVARAKKHATHFMMIFFRFRCSCICLCQPASVPLSMPLSVCLAVVVVALVVAVAGCFSCCWAVLAACFCRTLVPPHWQSFHLPRALTHTRTHTRTYTLIENVIYAFFWANNKIKPTAKFQIQQPQPAHAIRGELYSRQR